MERNKPEDGHKQGVLAIVGSALAAFIGIQNDQNRERDFQQKSIVPYMIAGVIITAVFITGLVMIAVRLDPTGG